MQQTIEKAVNLLLATAAHRKQIYAIRHEVYARELQQHQRNDESLLYDELDENNEYLVAEHDGEVAGFISITPPEAGRYSIDKYFHRSATELNYSSDLYEVRLLTVRENHRRSAIAILLMYAAYRWVQVRGGEKVVAICRADLLKFYTRAGMEPSGHRTTSGKVTYELATASIQRLNQVAVRFEPKLKKMASKTNWQLPFDFFPPARCYHGGSFFKAIGEDLQTISKAREVINADVLDAWFPASPKVLKALKQHLSWLLQTSPPTHASGLENAIAFARGVRKSSVLAGGGSSDLIFLALPTLLSRKSKVLIVDPCYGEYVHVLQQIIQCEVHRFSSQREQNFHLDTGELLKEIMEGYDMVILVNPNSPTGVYTGMDEMMSVLRKVPPSTLVWIDETYIEYIGSFASLEKNAAESTNVIVCKSMSKVYALSGARAAYLCAPPHLLEKLRGLSPPWSVSLPAQMAAIEALKDPDYYEAAYRETHRLRRQLYDELKALGITEIAEGCANFLLFFLPDNINAAAFIRRCREKQLFLRDVENMGRSLKNAVRIAVKDEVTNQRMVAIIGDALQPETTELLKGKTSSVSELQ